MSPIASVVYLQDKLEGNFRFKHMSIRTHAESVAFYNSGKNELTQTNRIFHDLLCKLLHYLAKSQTRFEVIYSYLKPYRIDVIGENFYLKCALIPYNTLVLYSAI
jgi:ABC-type uncharacterized transport system fused permease/ATPase subunit